jgi:hypothetical protein
VSNNRSDDDSFGDVMPQAAVDLPSAVSFQIAEGLTDTGDGTRISEVLRAQRDGD